MSRRFYVVGGCVVFAILALFFSLHRTYSPGPLLNGHARFTADCAACHQPWRGVEIASTGCVDCHGGLEKNPHADAFLDDPSGLLKGRVIPALLVEKDRSQHQSLACMSCHTDHLGRMQNMVEVSGHNCDWCHQHDSIADVSSHAVDAADHGLRIKRPMQLEGVAQHIFAGTTSNGTTQLFSHKGHLQDTIDKLAKVKEQESKLRSPAAKKRVQADIAGLSALLDSSGQHFVCRGCHVASAAQGRAPELLSFSMAGCQTAGCHSGFHDDALRLEPTAPDFAQQQRNSGPDPLEIRYVAASTFRHVEANFRHSVGHLKSSCADCHFEMEKSDKPGDYHSKKIANCFSCHAHQPAMAAQIASTGGMIVGVAVAAVDQAPVPERRVTACAECHAFHSWYQGGKLATDFAGMAPAVRPHPEAGIHLRTLAVSVADHGGGPRLHLRHVSLRAWWMTLLAIALMGVSALAYVRFLPQDIGLQRTKGEVAPQRTTEVPELDDSFQSAIEGLYVVGETAGTASINMAMRSGRQAAEFIANALKVSRPTKPDDVYDVLIVGAGPAGISASATAKSRGISYLTLEKTTAASTIRDYPRGKFVQATPLTLTEYGSLLMEGDYDKETLVRKWEEMLGELKLDVKEHEEAKDVRRVENWFEVRTVAGNVFKALYVILAIGVRGTPRKLGVAGETTERVHSKLVEPEEFQGRKILVVGGGNAGAEVAQALCAPELNNQVAYSFRDPVLGPPVTPENAEKISALQGQGRLVLYPLSQVKELVSGAVTLEPRSSRPGATPMTGGTGMVIVSEAVRLENDVVFAMLGAELPTKFMKA
ncbi:MAG TPA: NAD(P)-binding domain-containing protein, partial [Candidatus Binataceae bacterium]|nr:NAD(P)-binding domain-containing protein [Candidatus Binataceae bacterium]